MRRLKPSEVKAWREHMLALQGGECLLCGKPLCKEDAVADHSHKHGWMRGVLHRGCNALLGKIENNHKRMGVPDLSCFLDGVKEYLAYGEAEPFEEDGPYHPSYRTPEEKRLLRNKRARLKRKAKKSAATT